MIGDDEAAEAGVMLVAKIKPLLAGWHPSIQGSALVKLVATYIAGHHPSLREEMLRLHIEFVKHMIPVCERDGTPEDWF